MSRIGKKSVELPAGVSASLSGQTIEVKGPKGVLSFKGFRHATRLLQACTPAVGHEPHNGCKLGNRCLCGFQERA